MVDKERYSGICSLLPEKVVDLHISNDHKNEVISKAIHELEKNVHGLAMGPKASRELRSGHAEKHKIIWQQWAKEAFELHPRYGYKNIIDIVIMKVNEAGHRKLNDKHYSKRTIRDAIAGVKQKNN